MSSAIDHPLVSVLLPSYNAGLYLRPALESVLRQTYSHLEILIIDDGSTDDSFSTITNITDSRITIIHQENSGKAAALNKALAIMKGEYWLIQDADDLSYPNRVEKLLEALTTKQQLAAVFSGHDLLVKKIRFAPTMSPLIADQCNNLINNVRIPAHDATGMYRTEQVRKLEWDPELRIGQGIDFILRVGELFPISRLEHCLYTYRINNESIIRKNPAGNIKWINQAIQKACNRRGLNYSAYCLPETTKKGKQTNSELNHIVPHCMDSVVDLKISGYWLKAVQTGLTCLKIAPSQRAFYKPLIYSLLPIALIQKYRDLKKIT